jgi:RES domain-containing protein
LTEDRLHFEGVCFRHSAARYATVDEGTLEASMRAGGRFNPAGEFGAVYVALDEETALAELGRRIDRTGLPRKHFRPRMMLQLRVRLVRVLDLTDPEVRSQLGVATDEISGAEWARAQGVARQAREQGYTAIRFPSATGTGQNLAIFLDRLGPDEHLEVERVKEVRLD